MKHTANKSDRHCEVAEHRNLVSRMTECDRSEKTHDAKVKCYLKASKDSRESKDCRLG